MTIETTDPAVEHSLDRVSAALSSIHDEYQAVLSGKAGAPGPQSLGGAMAGEAMRNLPTVMQIRVEVKAVLGSTSLPIASLMTMRRGTVVALDRRVGEPIELMVNGRVVARGEVVILEDGTPRLGVTLTEVVGVPESQIEDAQGNKAQKSMSN